MTHFIRYTEETLYWDPVEEQLHPFPSLADVSSVALSVIVPSYNEETRLPLMLDETLGYLSDRQRNHPEFTWELIIVDDGSSDKTATVGWDYGQKWGVDRVRVVKLVRNRGKGGAVRLGMLCARGGRLLMADADGATKFSDFEKLNAALTDLISCDGESSAASSAEAGADTNVAERQMAVAVGSRAHLEAESIAKRSLFRTLLMVVFHALVWLFAVRSVKDTQCGFKLFTRAAARRLFGSLHVEGWAFDAELLFLATGRLGIPVAEVAVTWHEVDGSKITPVLSYIEMGWDLFTIWLWYFLGIWTTDLRKSTLQLEDDGEHMAVHSKDE